jgi:hypothetical protein
MKKKLYVETSVWNQVEQDERSDFKDIAIKFFKEIAAGRYDIFISEVVLWEIDACKDGKKRSSLMGLIERHKPALLLFDDEAQALRTKYIEAGVMTDTRKNRFYDTAHVAIAAVNQIPYLLTFNFVHLLKISKLEGFNGVNILNGYGAIQLMSPEIFIPEEERGGNNHGNT